MIPHQIIGSPAGERSKGVQERFKDRTPGVLVQDPEILGSELHMQR